MQKLNKFNLLIGIFLVFLVAVLLFSCGEEDVKENCLKELKITTTLQDTFYVGENVDFSLAEFQVIFKSGEVKNVSMQDENMSSNYANINNEEAGERTVIFIYRLSAIDVTYVNFVIHFVEDSVASISVDTNSFISSVKQNDTLDLTGIRVSATYASGKQVALTYADVTLTDYSTQNVGTLDIEVWYKTKCEHIHIQVIAHNVVMCEAQGLNQYYSVGSDISFADIRLLLTLDDGSTIGVWGEENVEVETNVNSSVPGSYYVQFTYIGTTYLVLNEDDAKTLQIAIIVN